MCGVGGSGDWMVWRVVVGWFLEMRVCELLGAEGFMYRRLGGEWAWAWAWALALACGKSGLWWWWWWCSSAAEWALGGKKPPAGGCRVKRSSSRSGSGCRRGADGDGDEDMGPLREDVER